MNRREWVWRALSFCLGFLSLARCGNSSSSSGGGGADGNCSNGATVSYTNPGHAHSASDLTGTQVTAATAGSYVLLSGSHSHAFTLSASDFAVLAAGNTLTKTDSDGHGHTITIGC